MSGFRTILVPYDFSSHARAALGTAVDLGRRTDADLHLLHVIQPPSFAYGYGGAGGAVPPSIDMIGVRESAADALADVARGLADFPGKLETHVFESPSIAGAVQDAARELAADLVVMGTHGRTGLAHVFLGSVAERTLRGAPCPVMTVRAEKEDDG